MVINLQDYTKAKQDLINNVLQITAEPQQDYTQMEQDYINYYANGGK